MHTSSKTCSMQKSKVWHATNAASIKITHQWLLNSQTLSPKNHADWRGRDIMATSHFIAQNKMDGINQRIFLLWKWGGAVYCTSANPGTFEMLYEGSVHCEKLVGVIEELKLRGGGVFWGTSAHPSRKSNENGSKMSWKTLKGCNKYILSYKTADKIRYFLH